MKVIALIPAAGLGTRMAPPSPGKGKTKQFTELRGTPILIHTLRKFALSPAVSEIYLALRPEEMSEFRARLKKEGDLLSKPVEIVAGGEHRQQSVANLLAAISATEDDIVLVHDAVRPFVSEEIIEQVIEAARKYGAAIAATPAVDTVKQVDRTADGALVTATIPRERVVMAQTPQGFRYGVLKKAFDEAGMDGFLGTDEASLIERAGGEVAVVMGSPRNIKITTPWDLQLAEFFLKK